MVLQTDEHTFDGFYHPASLRAGEPYEHSIASSVSSSQPSIFSETCSLQSSIASSISDDFRHNPEDARDRACAQLQIQSQASIDSFKAPSEQSKTEILSHAWCPNAPSYADVTSVPKQQRQHPRRNSLARSQRPPTLVRQDDRKVNFVESLVGKLSNVHRYISDQMLRVSAT